MKTCNQCNAVNADNAQVCCKCGNQLEACQCHIGGVASVFVMLYAFA